jgi:hypothetical protein
MPGPETAATFRLVRSLVANGDEVMVVSPSPSAAHHHADPGGPRGAARLARLANGVDRLIVRLDAAALGAGADPRRLLPGRLGISAALRRARRAEVRLDRVPSTVGTGFAKLVLGPAAAVVVSTEEERAALVAAGVDEAKVAVDPEPEADAQASIRRASSGPVASKSVNELQAVIREWAAAERAAGKRVAARAEGEASLPLRHLVRMEPARPRSQKPGGKVVKRLVAKLTAWQFDNVIGHVNRLHQATIEALENLEAQRDEDDTTTS